MRYEEWLEKIAKDPIGGQAPRKSLKNFVVTIAANLLVTWHLSAAWDPCLSVATIARQKIT